MTSYSYVNGCFEVTTFVREGYKRFHNCNAQYQVTHGFPYDNYYFVSYATPIMFASYNNISGQWFLRFNGNPYDYSPTTSRQFSRFICENDIPVTANMIKEAYNGNKKYTFADSNIRIEFLSYREMQEYYFARF